MSSNDEITRLRAENERLREWNREIALNGRELVAENERLRAALEDVVQEATEHHAENVSRAELGGSDMAQRKAKAIVSRSGVLLYKIRFIARAALDGQPAPGKEEA